MTSHSLFQEEIEPRLETHGIERVSPHLRTHRRLFDTCTLWLSANFAISTLAIGTLASTVFGLGFWNSLLTIILFTLLGTLPVAFLATLGPRLGLRQMTLSRFSFGWFGTILMALFNVAATIGWTAVNVIVGGELIESLSGGAIPRQVGILFLALVTTIISIYGYRSIHHYARYAWIPMAFVFALLMIVAAPHLSLIATPAFSITEIASCISFGGAVFGFATGWSSLAADYTVKLPETTSATRVFWYTFLGVAVPCIVLEIFGMALTSAYKGLQGGPLLVAVVKPLGGLGTCLLLVLFLSVIANNIPNGYSLGFSMQVLGKPFQRLSRDVWTMLGSVISVLIAVAASANFSETLSNFLLLIAYWLGPWSIILLLEHFLFRQGRYNVEDWNTPKKLPGGWAALAALGISVIGVLLGAAQVYYVGPLARMFNTPFGMDIGFEMGIVFAAIAYLFLRNIEWFMEARASSSPTIERRNP